MITWKKLVMITAITAGGAITIAAGDNYFEIGKNLEIFNELYKELNIFYVDDTKPGDLMKTGIDAMLESLDPYTNFIAEDDLEDYRFMTTGQYGGIGALIKATGDYVSISEPYEGFPAQKAGLMAGDEILSVDGRDCKGKNYEEVSKLLKGQAGTEVKVTIRRNGGAPEEHPMKREEIKIPDVPYKGIIDQENHVGYFKLNSFTQTAGQEVRDAMKELKDQGATKLIFDLRGNGGGLLREAVNIVNLFVPKGELVVSTKGKIAEWDKTYKTLSEPLDADIPVVLLVDEGSASASEIVTGSLQDLDRAVVVGQRTYGKGLVQQTRDLMYNNKLKVTVAKYYIPSGRCIQKIDYAHHDSAGKAMTVPDSLLTEFKTRHGRSVRDGRGIKPDVEVEEAELPKVVGGLYVGDVFYDYANHYRWTHDSIPSPEKFVITDAIYADFITFTKGKKYDYDTESSAKLNELIAAAKKERYYDHAAKEIEALQAELSPDRTEDLTLFRKDIEEVLRNEIVARYYYQTGRAKASLSTDPWVKKALDVINGPSYSTILAGTKP